MFTVILGVNTMKKLILALATISSSFVSSGLVYADAPLPDNQLTFNAAVTSDYRYRGISQTRLNAALQGGTDYTNNPTGLYVGAWASTIKWIKDAGGDSNIELDIYGGKRGNITDDLTYDVGVLTYVYAGNKMGSVDGFSDANTTEVYGQLGYGPAYIKYSHAVTNLFGFVDSKNSGYVDVGANIEISSGYILNLHAGHQEVENVSVASYDDWKIGVTKDFGAVIVAVAAIGTNADESAYASPANGKFLGKNALVATLSKTF
jgi:uncharacterized protein (TIGR02001 family)